MPYNLHFSERISVFQMEGAYLSFLCIGPGVIVIVVWSQSYECVTKNLFHLLKGLLLSGNSQLIGVQYTPCVAMNWLVICVADEQRRGKDVAFYRRPLFCLRHLLRLPTRSTQNRLFYNMFWVSL